MHYFDSTFPLQFPFYNPTIHEGGRGWLFLLVMRTEPLYHAALSAASYHQHHELIHRHMAWKDCSRIDAQLERYNMSLHKLQAYVGPCAANQDPNRSLECMGLLACIVFLISLEVGSSSPSKQPQDVIDKKIRHFTVQVMTGQSISKQPLKSWPFNTLNHFPRYKRAL